MKAVKKLKLRSGKREYMDGEDSQHIPGDETNTAQEEQEQPLQQNHKRSNHKSPKSTSTSPAAPSAHALSHTSTASPHSSLASETATHKVEKDGLVPHSPPRKVPPTAKSQSPTPSTSTPTPTQKTSASTTTSVPESCASSSSTGVKGLTGMRPLVPISRGPISPPKTSERDRHVVPNSENTGPSASAVGPSPSASPPVSDAIRPSQFSRAIQLLNSLVLTEWNTVETEEGRGRRSGWLSVWTSSTADTTTSRSYTGVVNHAREDWFKLQPVWLLTDGDSMAVIDFNGTAQHHNYKTSMGEYLSQLSTSKASRAGGQLPPPSRSPHNDEGAGSHHRSSSSSAGDAGGGERDSRQQDCNVVTWLAVDFTSDFVVGSTMAVAPSLIAGLHLTTHLNRERWSIRGSTSGLDQHHFQYGKAKALIVLLRGRLLVQSVLEEMCNGYMPPFMEDAYEHGVRLEGRWCLPQSPDPVSSGTGRQKAAAPSLAAADSGAAAVHRLWRPAASTSVEVPPAAAAVWRDLFPAVEMQMRREEHSRQLGLIAIPRVLLDELDAAVRQFPRYTPFPPAAAPTHPPQETGIPSPPLLTSPASGFTAAGAGADSAESSATPQSFIFTGRGTRLGGTLAQADARRRFVETAQQQSASASCSSIAPTGGLLHNASSASAWNERSASSPADGAALLPPSPNARNPHLEPEHTLVGRRADDLTHVSALSATGPSLKQVWEQYQQAAKTQTQRPSAAGEEEKPQTDPPPAGRGRARGSITRSHTTTTTTRGRHTSPSTVVSPSLCHSVLVYTPHGRIRLERIVPVQPPRSTSSASSIRATSTNPPHPTADGSTTTRSASTTNTPTEAQFQLPMVTIKDCKASLLRSALGRSLRLNKENIHFIFAPGTPVLSEDLVLYSNEAVLRLLTRRKSC